MFFERYFVIKPPSGIHFSMQKMFDRSNPHCWTSKLNLAHTHSNSYTLFVWNTSHYVRFFLMLVLIWPQRWNSTKKPSILLSDFLKRSWCFWEILLHKTKRIWSSTFSMAVNSLFCVVCPPSWNEEKGQILYNETSCSTIRSATIINILQSVCFRKECGRYLLQSVCKWKLVWQFDVFKKIVQT